MNTGYDDLTSYVYFENTNILTFIVRNANITLPKII